jgi:D-alanine-D-alanine ligase
MNHQLDVTPRQRVAILYGGRSVEHGVSINSARNIFEYIDKEKFEPLALGISQQGTWYLGDVVSKEIERGKEISLRLNPQHPEFTTLDREHVLPDVVFPVLHGTDGEDGSIQGLLKTLDLPMVGTGVLGSSVSINKLVAKKMLKQAGLPVADFLFTHFGGTVFSFEQVKEELGLPFMVKSTSLGSSVGVSKVKSESDFAKAVDDAFRYDDSILFEEFVQAREMECGVIGNEKPEASLPGEIIISKAYDFYTFDAKYVDGEAVKIDVPAKINEKDSARIRELSIKAYQALHCEDFARVDLFLTEGGDVFINEINTIPGFTNSSMFPMMWKERGVSFTDLITRLIGFALERHAKSKRIERGYQSNLKF